MTSSGAQHCMRVRISPDAGWFTGHFVGRPILPGIAHLALVRAGLRAVLGSAAEIGALDRLRLRRIVVPGDVLALRLPDVAFGRPARFELRCGETMASGGSVTPVERGAVAEVGLAAAATSAAGGDFPVPAELVPQRPPMLLLERIIDIEANCLTAVGRIPAGNTFVEDGAAPGFVGLEVAAQAAAAYEGLVRRRDGGDPNPRVGYLVGAREVRCAAPLPADSELGVVIRMSAAVLPLSTYELEVRTGDTLCAKGSISTFIQG